jgi:putative ABC transport system substrate-binding protein
VIAAELVRQKVDVIFAAGDVFAARAAKQATATIPIVMAVSGDPVKLGLVASLARPGGNLTGITYLEDELVAKQIELLKEVVPTLSRVGALVDSADPACLAPIVSPSEHGRKILEPAPRCRAGSRSHQL